MIRRRRIVGLCALLVAVLMMTACGPIMSTSRRADAEKALEAAAAQNAAELAPYEYTLAQEYLRKADELWGYSKFGASADYAQKSIEMSQKAVDKANRNPWKNPLAEQKAANRVVGSEAQ